MGLLIIFPFYAREPFAVSKKEFGEGIGGFGFSYSGRTSKVYDGHRRVTLTCL